MSDKLSAGFKIKSIFGFLITVEKYLGEGGQGSVYSVRYNGELKALKWYKKVGMGNDPTSFYENIKSNVSSGAPSDAFLWPIDVTDWFDGTFGYIMDLRPDGFYEVTSFMLRQVQFSSYKTAIDSALEIVTAFRVLHNKGYSYQDINDGNFFINPKNGKVLICDNDNVAPNGVKTGILGKPRYMAPEIVMNRKMPDNLSDRFSMSVILFILFCLNHPFEGKRSLVPCLTPSLQEKLYGSDAIFIMESGNTENPPDKIIHKNAIKVWPCLPFYVKELFLKAFCKEATLNPNARPKEVEWINVLVRFRNEILRCECGNEVFTENGNGTVCESCGKKISVPFILEFNDYKIPAVKDSRIYKCQVGISDVSDALQPIGRVFSKKDNPKMLGIKNLSDKNWNATTPSGKTKKVVPDEIIPIIDGISFEAQMENIRIIKNDI